MWDQFLAHDFSNELFCYCILLTIQIFNFHTHCRALAGLLRAMKYVLVTGGVISGIGKGVIASSLGMILKSCGVRVTSIKIDPYINIDAGTFSPYEHGLLSYFLPHPTNKVLGVQLCK